MPSKHDQQSQRTRSAIIRAAEQLFASRGIDAVPLNEVMRAAEQKNRNALQYHFGNREGLLQAILERHASEIISRRSQLLDQCDMDAPEAIKAVTEAFINPIAEHIETAEGGIDYIRILAQLTALDLQLLYRQKDEGLQLPQDPNLTRALALLHQQLSPAEARQRMFLAISFVFHGLADIYSSGQVKKDTAAAVSLLIDTVAHLLGQTEH